MKSSRISGSRGAHITFQFNDETIDAYEGETVAAALLANGVEAFGVTRQNTPRAPLCNMGTCFDCAVTDENGKRLMRSCLTEATDGQSLRKYEAS